MSSWTSGSPPTTAAHCREPSSAKSLELTPFGKLLYSSDAFGLPELYYLSALLFRRGLAGLLEDLVNAGEATPSDAERITALILHQNARRVYGLGPTTPA